LTSDSGAKKDFRFPPNLLAPFVSHWYPFFAVCDVLSILKFPLLNISLRSFAE
jgi:hypothetical protein